MARAIRKAVWGFMVLAGVWGTVLPALAAGPSLLGVAPNFTLQDLQGNPVELSAFTGKVVLLDFWATWCEQCTRELSRMKAIYEKYRDRGLVVLGVSLDETDPEALQAYVEEKQIPYPVLVGQSKALEGYRVNPLPAYYLIDQRGTIRYKAVGFEPGMALGFERRIQALLSSGTSAPIP